MSTLYFFPASYTLINELRTFYLLSFVFFFFPQVLTSEINEVRYQKVVANEQTVKVNQLFRFSTLSLSWMACWSEGISDLESPPMPL